MLLSLVEIYRIRHFINLFLVAVSGAPNHQPPALVRCGVVVLGLRHEEENESAQFSLLHKHPCSRCFDG